ncbi:MAG TPA: fatty acid--CoA ligase family protein [Bryobacteraceae bacterium]|nr:fatty acid--CoA ligase family protein [Bryobacteraceae bacterium]
MIAERLREVAEDNPGNLALVDGRERITYGQLLQRIDSAREWLRQRHHIAPGDVVLVSLENSWQLVACFFAIAELGGVCMPVHTGWRAPELRVLHERLKIRVVITGRAIDDGFGEAPGSPRAHPGDVHSPALYLATSGSTGTPRIVPRSHGNLLAGARNVARALNIDPERRFLCVVPFYHSSGFHNSLIVPLLNGARLIVMRNFTPAACARLVRAEGADVLIGSPFIYRMLLEQAQDLPTLNLCVSAGARMAETLSVAWQERFGTRIRQLYGSTETNVISIDRSTELGPPETVGTPIDEVEVRILDDGEVAVRSPMVMSGYVADPEWNLRVFDGGFFRTGDLGSLDSDGRLRLYGRTRRVVNLAGVKVDPVEIEQVIESLAGVAACQVDAGNGDGESELIRARIEPREGVEMTRAAVIAHCRLRLADYKLPRIIEFVAALPVTLTGKTSRPGDRCEVRAQCAGPAQLDEC